MEVTVRWECEHGNDIVHWNPTEGSRAEICSPRPVSMEDIPWCETDDQPVRICGHDPTAGLVWRRGRILL